MPRDETVSRSGAVGSSRSAPPWRLPLAVAFVGVVCLGPVDAASGMKLLAIGGPPREMTLGAEASDLMHRLAARGYANVSLKVAGKTIAGTALLRGRLVHIVYDERGWLHVGSGQAHSGRRK